MRVVLDTNVLFSGIFHSGPPADILKDILKNKYQVVLSEAIVEEYTEVLHRPLKVKEQSIDSMKIVSIMISSGMMIDTDHIVTLTCPVFSYQNYI